MHIFWDLDGVVTGWPKFSEPNHSAISTFHELLDILKKDVTNTVITNRASSQTFSVAYELGAKNSLFICENGGVLFEVSSQKQFLNPKYLNYVEKIRPKAISFIENNFNISDFEQKNFDFRTNLEVLF